MPLSHAVTAARQSVSLATRHGLVAALLVLALLPLLVAILGSLIAPAGRTSYAQWWGTASGWQAMDRTVRLAGLAATVAVLLALTITACAVRLDGRGALAVAMLSCLPMLMPSSLLASAWIAAFGKQGSILLFLQQRLGPIDFNVFSIPAAAAAMACRYFGIAVLALMQDRLRQRRHWPAERVFRLSPLATLLHVRLRGLLRPAMAAWLLVALFCLDDHILPDMLLISTYGTQVLIQYSALLDPCGAAALAAPLAGVGVLLILLAARVGRGHWPALDQSAAGQARRSSQPVRLLAGLGALMLLGLPLAMPLAVLVGQTSWPAMVDAMVSAQDQLWQTLYVAGTGGLLCAVIGGVLAGQWLRSWQARRRSAVPLVLVNLIVPPTLLAIGLAQLTLHWPLQWLAGTSWPLIGAYVARFLPLAVLLLYAGWSTQPAVAEQAARVHAVPRTWLILRILWPQRRMTLLAAGAVCAALMAVELEMSILLAPPGQNTLGVRLYSLIHTAPPAMVSGLTLGLLLVVAPVVALLAGLVLRQKHSGAS